MEGASKRCAVQQGVIIQTRRSFKHPWWIQNLCGIVQSKGQKLFCSCPSTKSLSSECSLNPLMFSDFVRDMNGVSFLTSEFQSARETRLGRGGEFTPTAATQKHTLSLPHFVEETTPVPVLSCSFLLPYPVCSLVSGLVWVSLGFPLYTFLFMLNNHGFT